MKWFCRPSRWSALTLVLCAAGASSAPPPLPQRNLVIEWRQIDELQSAANSATRLSTVTSTHGGQVGVSAGVVVSTQHHNANNAVGQQLRVLNGGRTVLRLNQSVPVVWVQAVQADFQSPGGYHQANRANGGAAVVQGLTWLDAGRQITFHPRWPGGEQAAVVDVQVDSAQLERDRPSADALNSGASLPVQTRRQTATTVLAPLGQWVTIARTGSETTTEQTGVVSTQSATSQQRQLMQIRVIVP
jgi:hypothetical protein